MTVEYIKSTDGKVRVLETITTAKEEVKDLHSLKERKAEIENKLLGWHERFVEQKRVELAEAEAYMSETMKALQAEIDQIDSDIKGAEAVGVVEVIPPEPVPEPNLPDGSQVPEPALEVIA